MLHWYRTRAKVPPRAGKWCHKWSGVVLGLTSKAPRLNKLIPSPQNANESVSAICSSQERSEISWGKPADRLVVVIAILYLGGRRGLGLSVNNDVLRGQTIRWEVGVGPRSHGECELP